MRLLLIMAAAMLACAGCTTVDVDTASRKNLPAICSAASQAHGVYLVAAAFGKVSDRDQRCVDAAWSALTPTCAHPVQPGHRKRADGRPCSLPNDFNGRSRIARPNRPFIHPASRKERQMGSISKAIAAGVGGAAAGAST